ncbi:MAG: radical SAM protein [Elusimicrobia bacterium]|nr:radical SAM protein [Elusimicrobiota bacterium]
MRKRDCCEIILNHACDLGCAFCSQADFEPSSSMPAAEAVRHIYAARKAGFRRLGFSGGEALLRRDLPQLIKAARSVGFKAVRLQTNGIRLAGTTAAAELVKAGLTVCKFTFASHRPETHDRLVGGKGAFRKSLAGLENMLKLKAAVGVNLLVTKANYRNLPETLKFFMEEGVPNFVLIYPIHTGAMARSAGLRVSLPRAAPYLVEALRLASDSGLGREVKALNVPPCLLPGFEHRASGLYRFNTVVVAADGEKRDLDTAAAAARRRGPPCPRCYFGTKCRGVDVNYLELFGWKGIFPVKSRPAPARSKAGPFFTNNEKCFLELLRGGKTRGTAELLRAAKSVPLCYDCADGANVLLTGSSLVKKGLVNRSFRNGAYFWSLNDA